MTTPRHVFRIDQGAHWSVQLQYVQPDETGVDLTGRTSVLTVLAPVSAEALAVHEQPGTPDGTIDIDFTADETAAWPQGRAAITVDTLDHAGDRVRILNGTLYIREAHRV